MHSAAVYRLLGDEVRLRLLRLLALERLNVTELTGILGIAQSGVSRHLGLLRDAGLVAEHREGGYTFYALAPADANGHPGALWTLLEAQFADTAREPAGRADTARLQEVLRLRKENFDAHAAADGKERRQLVPGRSWAAWARALGLLLPPLRVADLGCGEGYLTLEAARWAKQVIAIDRSEAVLQRGRDLARRRRLANVVWRRGDIERLPIADASVDVALLSQALHHAGDPRRALAEARRILVDGGRVIILDLRAHEEAWVRERVGDRWLGFADDALARHLTDAGFDQVTVRVGARRTGDPFTVLIGAGTRRGAPAPRQTSQRSQRLNPSRSQRRSPSKKKSPAPRP